MTEFNIKYGINSNFYKVRNVKLVDINDPKYIAHRNKIIQNKRDQNPNKIRDDSLRQHGHISILFEKCIFHWMKSSNKRIIYWEEYNSGTKHWNKKYLELDILIEENDRLIIGEIKTKNDIMKKKWTFPTRQLKTIQKK